jgi:hypothetical protein
MVESTLQRQGPFQKTLVVSNVCFWIEAMQGEIIQPRTSKALYLTQQGPGKPYQNYQGYGCIAVSLRNLTLFPGALWQL